MMPRTGNKVSTNIWSRYGSHNTIKKWLSKGSGSKLRNVIDFKPHEWKDLHAITTNWDYQECLNKTLATHMAEAYAFKAAKFDLNTSNYIEALFGENDKDYFKAMYVDIVSLILWDTWKLVIRI